MAILAQTYLHLKVRSAEEQLAEAHAYFEYIGALSALENFQRDVEIEFRVEEGSLKGWLTVFGGLYAGICAYGSFREGIDYAVKDARAFSEYIIEHVKTDTDISHDALYRTERRLGLPGQIQRLYPLLDATSEVATILNKTPVHHRLDQVQEQIRNIAAELDASEREMVIEKLEESIPKDLRRRLPVPDPRVPMPLHVAQTIVLVDEKHISRGKPKDVLQRYPIPPNTPKFR